MKKAFDNDYEVVVRDTFEDIYAMLKEELPYPFERELLALLKKENKCRQKYYYIRHKGDFAFFILYENKMNIFTFGKLTLNVKLNVIGFPCSLSFSGYVTSNEAMMLDYIKTLSGAKLVLNVKNPLNIKGVTVGRTLPTCIFENRFSSVDGYLASLRSPYRRRLKRAIEKCRSIEVRETDGKTVYPLYLNTYRRSAYKLEKLEEGFFDGVEAVRLGFFENERAIGFVLLKKTGSRLIFMFCGMDYSHDTADLYHYMLYTIIAYAIENGCASIDLGQTSEETKLKLGAFAEERYFYACHKNRLINFAAGLGKKALEYGAPPPAYRVFKGEKNESIVGQAGV